ncbi:hypothetical protein BH10BAC3_BH10BAC3_27960 [soil metagenome]
MLLIISEDGPKHGVENIDAHRSILMKAGPYVKHGYVSQIHEKRLKLYFLQQNINVITCHYSLQNNL